MKKSIALVCIVSVVLTACRLNAPGCNDDSTKELVIKIFDDTVSKINAVTHALDGHLTFPETKVTHVVTLQHDWLAGRYTCEGSLQVSLNSVMQNTLNGPMGVLLKADPSISLNGSILSVAINYKSKVTDDGREQLVEVDGHEPLAAIVFGVLGANSSTTKNTEAANIKPKPLSGTSKNLKRMTVHGNLSCGSETCGFGSDDHTYVVGTREAEELISASCQTDSCSVDAYIEGSNSDWPSIEKVVSAVKK